MTGRALIQDYPFPVQEHMIISPGDQGQPTGEAIAIGRFLDGERGLFVKPVSQRLGEARGHMLNDSDGGGQIGGQSGKHLLQRSGSAGGGANDDQSVAGAKRARPELGGRGRNMALWRCRGGLGAGAGGGLDLAAELGGDGGDIGTAGRYRRPRILR